MRRVGRLVSNHSLSALLFYPKINEHDFYLKLNSIPTFRKKYVTVQPCDWQKREIEKVFSSDYPHGNT